jgi:hypothetical protein
MTGMMEIVLQPSPSSTSSRGVHLYLTRVDCPLFASSHVIITGMQTAFYLSLLFVSFVTQSLYLLDDDVNTLINMNSSIGQTMLMVSILLSVGLRGAIPWVR